MRAIGIVAIVVSLAFILAAGISYAKQEPAKHDMALLAPQRAIDAVLDIPPCFAHPRAPKRVTWMITAKDGTALVVGSEDVRKRC
ncbi:MAG TPA: hypothetical protein VGC14_02535 [Rhizobium sp.]